MPLEEKLPRHLSDDQTEADKVLLDMLMDDIPRTIVRSIVRSDSYDILVPSNISTSPYIAISYADDTEEEQFAFVNDTCPSQDSDFLTIPPGSQEIWMRPDAAWLATVGPLETIPILTSVRRPLSVGSQTPDLLGHGDKELEIGEETGSSLKLYGGDPDSDFTWFSDNE
ncbi:unnamed protein product [Rhizoctonia solani]|uniref:Uncharacterized protein n=1 Tax=Rhizoctonia solani TaxID=456999 RepID=A0A8H3CMC9_9AGAM|nr:unnamed protein product [Rhizoctonia solani]